ncbi:uncharacterized protein KY384_001027, partial [Bacidia gigantensis]|uniref:uncharacterized protein n=1 Tax=Bacidia gigantensis TaxID=2732470 RepID=UPI001D044081
MTTSPFPRTSSPPASLADSEDQPTHTITAPSASVSLTHSPLSIPTATTFVRSPSAGASVLFAGSTRDNFESKPVLRLTYSAYIPLALRTLLTIAIAVKEKHALAAIYIVHRLGECPVGEESVLVAVSAPHRGAAWRGGEEALERVKGEVEIWKREIFEGEDGAEGEGVWRANAEDGQGQRAQANG